MNDVTLNCEMETIPTADGAFIAFNLRNPENKTTTVQYFSPFSDFDLRAIAADGEVPLIQPTYDTGVQPMTLTIPAYESVRIDTPIQLRFDPNIGPSGGDVPTQWTLRCMPAPVLLLVKVRLNGATVLPCEAHFTPRAQSRTAPHRIAPH